MKKRQTLKTLSFHPVKLPTSVPCQFSFLQIVPIILNIFMKSVLFITCTCIHYCECNAVQVLPVLCVKALPVYLRNKIIIYVHSRLTKCSILFLSQVTWSGVLDWDLNYVAFRLKLDYFNTLFSCWTDSRLD